jgi:hypothetical protein
MSCQLYMVATYSDYTFIIAFHKVDLCNDINDFDGFSYELLY